MKEASRFPWECIFCGEAKPPRARAKGKAPITCGDRACKQAYNRCWKRDRPIVAALVARNLLGATPCP